jgi:hypothetical protein
MVMDASAAQAAFFLCKKQARGKGRYITERNEETMLTNTDWIRTGEAFPPKCEQERLDTYRKNELLFLGEHNEVFRGNFARMENYLKKSHREIGTVFNYPQLLTKKTADFVCGEPISIDAGKKTDRLGDVLAAMDFDTVLYEAVMDVSRFGDAPVKVMRDRISGVSPACWFPIVDRTDLKRIVRHVIAFPVDMDERGRYGRIYVEIHDPGQVEVCMFEAAYEPDGQLCFGGMIEAECDGPYKTGLSGFAVKVLKNLSHTTSVFGMDDYKIIAGLVEKLMWRLSCIDTVLDKHSEPSLSGPASALSYDNVTGLYYLDLGNYFKRDSKDDAGVEYLTWNGNLESSFREIDTLLRQIYIMSEMGAAFMEGENEGQASSGTALKLRLVSPRIKAQRIAGVNTQTLKQLLCDVAVVNGIQLSAKEIAIAWHDGLPDDPAEELGIRMAANGGKPVESQLWGIKTWNGLDDAAAQAMYEQIRGEGGAGADLAVSEDA